MPGFKLGLPNDEVWFYQLLPSKTELQFGSLSLQVVANA